MPSVLITGSSKGLGKSIALAFAFAGYDIILHGRDVTRLESVEKDVVRYGVRCQVIVGDLNEELIITELADCAKEFNLDILVNNAAIYLQKPIEEVDDLEMMKLFSTNLFATITLTKKIFEYFKKKRSGLIININSVAGKNASAYESAYSATKHALRGFMNAFQFEALRYGVMVLNIYLGAMQTDMTSGRREYNNLIKPKEVADVIVELSKNYSSLRISEIEILRKLY